MRKSNYLFPALAIGLTAVSCQDYDAGFSEADFKKKEYSENFEKVFGKIDPKQDWNMAQQINAVINLPVSGASVVQIFEVDPLASVNAKYLSYVDVVDGKASWKFDSPKTDKELFVQVKQGANRVFAGYCAVENGQLIIEEGLLHKNLTRALTRAGEITKGSLLWTELTWDDSPNTENVIVENYGTNTQVKQIKIEGSIIYYTPDVTTVAFRPVKYNDGSSYKLDTRDPFYYSDGSEEEAFRNVYLADFINEDLTFKSGVVKSAKSHVAKTYAINGETKTTTVKWLIGDCKDLFWVNDAPLLESEDYRSARKKAVYAEYGTNVEEIEGNGVLFTTSKEDAEIDIPFMFGATQNHNILGYYYYKEGEQDPREVNRYVLYDDARPSENIKVEDVAVDGMDLASQKSGWTDNSIVECTSRHLMYFGLDGTQTGTTKFPKDIKIGFFIRRQPKDGSGNLVSFRSITPNSPGGETGYAYSTAAMNKAHFYYAAGGSEFTNDANHGFWDYRGADGSECSDPADPTKGNVKAMTWDYGGRVLVGFGDDSGDCDLNDFVFWVNGDIKEKPKVKIDVKDTNDVYEWMVACEDLGSTEDYDFNDVVFGVKNYKHASNMYVTYIDPDGNMVTTVPTVIDESNYLVITPYAAGGTLKSDVYYNSTKLGEIHTLVNNNPAYESMATGSMPVLNAAQGTPTYVGTPVVIRLANDFDFTMSATDMGGFSIVTHQKEGDQDGVRIQAPATGSAPQMMVLPTGWDWPSERTLIHSVYPDFETWSTDKEANGWVASKDENASFVTNPYKTAEVDNDEDGGGSGPDYSQYGTQLSFSPVTIEGNSGKFVGVEISALKQISETGPVTITLICSSMDQWTKSANAIYYQQHNKGWIDNGESSNCDYDNMMVTITLNTEKYNKFITPEVEYDKALIALVNIEVSKMFIKVNEE